MSKRRFALTLRSRMRRLTATTRVVIYVCISLVSFISILAFVDRMLPVAIINTDDCLWTLRTTPTRAEIVVDQVSPGGNADVAGVHAGDVVVAIDSVDLSSFAPDQVEALQQTGDGALDAAPLSHPIPYIVERNGVRLRLMISITQQFYFTQLLMVAVAAVWLIVGLLVVLPRPMGGVQRQFFLLTALVIYAFVPFPRPMPGPMMMIAGSAWMFAGGLFYPAWLVFCSMFPVDQHIMRRRWGRVLVLAIVAAALFESVSAMALYSAHNAAYVPTIHLIGQIGRGFHALGMLGGIAFLIRGYMLLPASHNRRAVLVTVVGSCMAATSLLYVVSIEYSVKGVALLYPQYLLPALLLMALPFSFAYALFRYQVMDFGRVIKTTVIYACTMTLIAAAYLAVAFAVGQAVGSLMQTAGFREVVQWLSFVLFLLLFEPMKRNVQRAIENRFFPGRRDYSGRLAQYTATITEMIGAQAVAQHTALVLQESLDLRGVCVAIEDPADGELRPVARASEFAPVPVDSAAIESLRGLLRNSHDLILLETTSDPRLEHLQGYFPYVIGMYTQGRITGTILMSRPHGNGSLSGSQIAFISGVASQAAAALEVARLYEGELARQRYREELATARRIQESLLPTTMPVIPGIAISALSWPAQAVGGDYYDVIPVGGNRFLVTIADVSGKGLPASLYMAQFHGMVHVASGHDPSPRAILTTLNEHLFEVMTRGSFITATMLLFDTRRRTMSYARAGHTPIVRRTTTGMQTLVPAGVGLGLCSSGLFAELLEEFTVEYEPGDTFILYSDGVSEAMNADREEFGDERLMEAITDSEETAPDVLRDRIVRQLESFRGAAEQNDDITVVVVRMDDDEAERVSGGSDAASAPHAVPVA